MTQYFQGPYLNFVFVANSLFKVDEMIYIHFPELTYDV